jgi:hypothetical protein
MKTWTHGHMDTWTHGHMETSTHGDMDMKTWTGTWPWRLDIETGRHGHEDMDMDIKSNERRKTEAEVTFLTPFSICS